MIGLLTYGSLMHPDELLAQLGREHRCVLVRLNGFRRSFCQEPAWRRGDGEQRGVLTVRSSPADWMNCVLICDQDIASLESLDHRERGYRRQLVAKSSVQPYSPNPVFDEIQQIHLYSGRQERWNEGLQPNPEYLELCMDAAKSRGDRFLMDFLSTTFIGTDCLQEVVQREGAT